ncbi:MAG: CheR family methyltransferase [Verrucomicrobiota bacterium]
MANREKRSARKRPFGERLLAPDPPSVERCGPVDEIKPRHRELAPPTVAVGGAEGSVGPLQTFFRQIPGDSGMQFLVLVRLSADEERSLPRRLQRCTATPVVRAANGMRLERNTVYLVPRDKYVTSVDERLWLSNCRSGDSPSVALDRLFRALAEAQGAKATAIVLSGANGDGAFGIRRIKEAGGLTIAQEPTEAEYRQMPVASISTGSVDCVLAVAEMPARMMDYHARSIRLKLPPPTAPSIRGNKTEAALLGIVSLLGERTKRDFSHLKRTRIIGVIGHRMTLTDMDDLSGYLTLLRSYPAEIIALVRDLDAPASSFVHDRESLAVLQEYIGRLFEGKTSNDAVRFWVPACASGEEAYSLAIIALECASRLELAPRIQIFGCDPDDAAIQAARRGFYPKTICADISAQRLSKFFTEESRGYRVRRELRELLSFASHDLLRDAPFSRMDLVSCRNLLIYLNPAAQQRSVEIFHFALNDRGLLFLGAPESLRDSDPLFATMQPRHRLYERRPGKRLGLPAWSRPDPRRALGESSGNAGVQSAWEGLERARAAEALRRSEEKYRTLFESMDQAFCLIEVLFDDDERPIDGRLIEVNPAFARHTGLGGVSGRRIRDLVPGLEEHWFQTFGRTALTGEPARFQGPAEALGRYYDVFAFRLGGPIERKVAVLFQDVTGRRRAELNSQFLIQLDGALNQFSLAAELEGEVTTRVAQFLGLSYCCFGHWKEHLSPRQPELGRGRMGEEKVTGHWLNECIAAESVDLFSRGGPMVVEDVFEDRRTAPFALQFGHTPMRAFVVTPGLIAGQWSGTLVAANKRPRAWREDEIELLREVAGRAFPLIERARAEEALRASEERLRLVVENAREYAIFSIDLQRQVTAWHRGAEAILGYSASDIVGQCGDIIFTPEDRESGVPEAETQRALTEGCANDERWHRRKDGSLFWGSGVLMPIRNAKSEAIGFVKIFRDQTVELRAKEALQNALEETERARAQAESASKAKDDFLAVLSHELRTPLTPVLMAVRTLLRRQDLPETAVEGLEMIRRNVEVEAHLIGDLLDLSRIGRGARPVACEPMDLHDTVRGAIEISKPDMESKRQRLITRLEARQHRVKGDFMRLQQVFWNLLKNASKFTPEGGEIRIRSHNARGQIILEVRDNGMGIRAEALPKIFDPFVQADASVARRYGGLGLGLALSKATVDAHNGAIRAESAGTGQGANLIVELPLLAKK